MNNQQSNLLISIGASIVTSAVVTALMIGGFHGQSTGLLGSTYGSGNASTTDLANQNTIEGVVQQANPAVVSITISKKISAPTQQQQFFDPFGFFGGNSFHYQSNPNSGSSSNQPQEIGGGSGFLVSSDGLIITNKHVVDDPTASYTVYTNDGKSHTAKVVAEDPFIDLAFVKIEGTGYPTLALGDSSTIKVGQTAIAIGNALDQFRNTVSVGVISGLARNIVAGDETGSAESLDQVIQTDAAINPGNSGGPLLDLSGKVVGIDVAIVDGSQNIGFALPINSVKSALDSVQKTGKIVRPYLGIRYLQIDSQVQQSNHLSVDYGVLVERGNTKDEVAVIPGSPADKAGIVENDIILSVNGTKLTSDQSLTSIIGNMKVGDKVNLQILHKGKTENVMVTLEAYSQ